MQRLFGWARMGIAAVLAMVAVFLIFSGSPHLLLLLVFAVAIGAFVGLDMLWRAKALAPNQTDAEAEEGLPDFLLEEGDR